MQCRLFILFPWAHSTHKHTFIINCTETEKNEMRYENWQECNNNKITSLQNRGKNVLSIAHGIIKYRFYNIRKEEKKTIRIWE